MTERDARRIFAQCTKFLNGHYTTSPQAMLQDMAMRLDPELPFDRYGGGRIVEDFEEEIAALLGKPAAIFMPTGTMAQQIALRIWADRTGNPNIVFHPTCHLEVHEDMAYRLLHGLNGIPAGNRYRLLTLQDVEEVEQAFGTLVLELPQRHLGGELPAWEALDELVTWARDGGIMLHLDGARLWETQPFYDRDYAEIAGLFDTVYVSFYKILNGIAGAMLAGPEDVIDEARVWRHRHGGMLFGMFPMIVSAKNGLDKHLPQMASYHRQAKAVAAALSELPGIEITPNPPHTNMMNLYLCGDRDKLWNAVLDMAEEHGVCLLRWLRPTEIPTYHATELVMGEASLDIEAKEVADWFTVLLKNAGATPSIQKL